MEEHSTKGTKRATRADAGKGKKTGRVSEVSSMEKIDYKSDSGYHFTEAKLKKADGEMQFSPKYFLRTHSKKDDPADVQTQIWQCCFEPNPDKLNHFLDIVATCGGTSVCFINVHSGKVVLKYDRKTKVAISDNFYSLAWSSLPIDEMGLKRMNIVAVGGGRATVLLMHPEADLCYQMFKTLSNKTNVAVCSLLFHPKKATWLFCGHEDGNIQIWDVRIPLLPSYDVTPVHLLMIPPVGGDVYNFAFSQSHDLLFAGCDRGLFAWHIDMEKVEKSHRLDRTELMLPNVEGAGQVVDSICLIRDDILVTKCVLHGYIYLFRISDIYKKAKLNIESGQKEIELSTDNVVQLHWSDTDNYYMNMGVDTKSCTLVCGDDKGSLWVYDLFQYVSGQKDSPLNGGRALKNPVHPDVKLEWPDLKDPEVEKARKLRLDTYDIVVDKCTVSDGAQYIVAVTSNNMVCIWERNLNNSEI